MEVLNSTAGLLCNWEVLKLVQEVSQETSGNKKVKKLRTNLANITFDTEKYLQQTACATQSAEVVHNFLVAAKHLPVTKFEKLQLLNLRPSKIVHLQLVLEEVEERFSEEEMKAMLDMIAEVLPEPPAPVETDHAEAGPSQDS